jgi:hypothetical protein
MTEVSPPHDLPYILPSCRHPFNVNAQTAWIKNFVWRKILLCGMKVGSLAEWAKNNGDIFFLPYKKTGR